MEKYCLFRDTPWFSKYRLSLYNISYIMEKYCLFLDTRSFLPALLHSEARGHRTEFIFSGRIGKYNHISLSPCWKN